jgi:catechol 2,3-dioxygenase-like lactoylglutathione lyase family enzyme
MAPAGGRLLAMSLARMRSVVLDCPDPRVVAEFYRGVLGGEIDAAADDWVVLTVDGLRLAFQLAEEFAAPTWPSGERPQQFHLDMTVADVDAVESHVLALGATKHAVQPGETAGDAFRVYLDPAGHPFCLCWD